MSITAQGRSTTLLFRVHNRQKVLDCAEKKKAKIWLLTCTLAHLSALLEDAVVDYNEHASLAMRHPVHVLVLLLVRHSRDRPECTQTRF